MADETSIIRKILLLVLGACVLILIAVGLFQTNSKAPEPPTAEEPAAEFNRVAAVVNGSSIYISEVEGVALAQELITKDQSLQPGDEIFIVVLEDLINQRLMAQGADKLGLTQQNEVQLRLTQARDRVLSNVLIDNHLEATVTEEALRALYEAQAAIRGPRLEVSARHIVVSDEGFAQNIIARLDKGEDFTALALAYSLDRASRDNGGNLGYFKRDAYSPEFGQQAFSALIGADIEPFQTDQGWHVLEVLDKRQASVPSFEAVREALTAQLKQQEIRKLIMDLHDTANISRTVPDTLPELRRTED
jgi:peptidyl-prolyl cis-trans isomerase C